MSSPSVSLIERRGHPRVIVELRCYTAAGASKPRVVVGHTVNISRSGALLLWDAAPAASKIPKLGDLLKVDLELPASSVGRKCIRCRGRVVRVYMAENRAPLIALAISQMDFRDHELHEPRLERIQGGKAVPRKDYGEAAI